MPPKQDTGRLGVSQLCSEGPRPPHFPLSRGEKEMRVRACCWQERREGARVVPLGVARECFMWDVSARVHVCVCRPVCA